MDNKQEHTPGPWMVGPKRHAGAYQLILHEGSPRGFICEVQSPLLSERQWDEDTREANARLIAAAPELLAALEAVAEGPEHDCGSCRTVADVDAHLLKIARAAIRKATGGQS